MIRNTAIERLTMKHIITTVCLVLTLVSSSQAADTLIKAGTIHTAAGKPLSPGMVLISNNKIVQVGKSIKTPKGAKVIDLGKGTLMPGMVDANARVPLRGGSSEVTREVASNYSIYMGLDLYQRRFKEIRSNGVTTLVVFPGGDSVIGGMACTLKSGSRSRIVDGFSALLLNMCSDPRSGNRSRIRPDSIYVRQPTNRMGVVWIMRQALAKAKKTNPAVSYMASLIRERRHIVARSRTAFDIRALLKVADEAGIAPTIIDGEESYKVADILAKRQVPVVLSPITPAVNRGQEATETVPNNAARLQQAGVKFAFSGGNLLEQARFAVRFGLSKSAALKAITINPAYIMGYSSRLGSIEPGKDADLVALTGDPLTLTSRIQWVMVNGVTYSSNGAINTSTTRKRVSPKRN